METLVLADDSLNDVSLTSLAFSSASLKSIYFGKNSCTNVTKLSFTCMKSLRSIFIDTGSFSGEVKNKKKKKKALYSFECHSCAELQEIVIESDCFCDYKECSIFSICFWFVYPRSPQTGATDDW